MSLVHLFYLSLVSPQLALLEVERSYNLSYLVLGLLGFGLSQVSLLICSSMIDHEVLHTGAFFLDLSGSMLTGVVQIIMMGMIIHVALSKYVDAAAFPRMLTSFLLAQVPFTYLVCVSILSRSLEVFGNNSALGLTFFLLTSGLLFGYVVYLIGRGIQIHYRTESWVRSFTVLVIALFVSILIQITASTGVILTFIGSLFYL